MRRMFTSVLKTIYKKKEAKICLIFAFFPFLLIITSLFPTNFMQLSGDAGSMSCLDFIQAVIYVQFQLTLPSIAFMYLAITCVHDEIKKGNWYLYKDIPRVKIFLCKSAALLVWYFIYFLCTCVSSIITYYVYVIKQPYASGMFFSNQMNDLYYIIITTLGIMLTFIISLLLVVALSLYLPNIASLVIGILFSLFSAIAPALDNINIFFPTGFMESYETIGFGKSILFTLIVSMVYIVVIEFVGNYKIKRIEF